MLAHQRHLSAVCIVISPPLLFGHLHGHFANLIQIAFEFAKLLLNVDLLALRYLSIAAFDDKLHIKSILPRRPANADRQC